MIMNYPWLSVKHYSGNPILKYISLCKIVSYMQLHMWLSEIIDLSKEA